MGLRRLARDIEGDGLRPPEAKRDRGASLESRPDVIEVFDFWAAKLAKKRAKLTPERARLIAARIKDGYTVQRLKSAIAGAASSDWHQQEVSRHELTLICRDGSHVERFEEMFRGGATSDAIESPDLVRAQREAERAMREGRMEDYEHWNREIGRIRSGAEPARAERRADEVSGRGRGGSARSEPPSGPSRVANAS